MIGFDFGFVLAFEPDAAGDLCKVLPFGMLLSEADIVTKVFNLLDQAGNVEELVAVSFGLDRCQNRVLRLLLVSLLCFTLFSAHLLLLLLEVLVRDRPC